MRHGRKWIRYRADLTKRAQRQRRDPTPAEKKLWFEFLRDLPDKFTPQKPLGRYIADFYCAAKQLVIEVDGDSHYDDAGERYDARRTSALALDGVRVLRVSNLDVMQNFQGTCEAIRRALSVP